MTVTGIYYLFIYLKLNGRFRPIQRRSTKEFGRHHNKVIV